jgi:hypothetical protein
LISHLHCIMLRLIDSDNPIDEVKSVEEEF